MLLDGAVEFFYQKQKIARFDSQKMHAFGLYRTNGKREGFLLWTSFQTFNP